jgi:hypothetical protein
MKENKKSLQNKLQYEPRNETVAELKAIINSERIGEDHKGRV